MHIRSITLHGFKSFGNRITLELSRRVSVIAGPNGSGKSNVVDGLRWATGGGRASEFRAGEKTELIFHGASGKRAVGYAEVEVEIETDQGAVKVRRTLQRDGSGTLRLNGKAARFMDVDEALSGTGLGKGSLAIIGQGEISGVLLADPARLLAFVAEAAGVSRLAGRFEQTESRLARAREHMIRLTDLHEELTRHLERLELEASDASLFQELARETLVLQYSLAHARRGNLEEELRKLAEQEDALLATTKALAEDRTVLGEDLAERREQLNALQEKYRQATASVEAWKGEIRLAENRHETVSYRLRDNRRQAGALQQEAAVIENSAAPTQPHGSQAELTADLERHAAHSASLARQQLELQARSDRSRASFDELQQASRTSEQARALHQERTAAVMEQLEAVRQRLAESGTADDGSGDAALLVTQLANRAEELSQLQEEQRRNLASAHEEHAHAAAEARSSENALARLQAAVEARSGFAEGPRIALTSQIAGIVGAVADLLEVDEPYRQALAAALGNRSEFVVVRSAESGRKVIEHVRDKRAFVTVLPLDLVRGRNAHVPAGMLEAPGVIGLAIGQTRFDDEHAELFSQLLGNTLLVEDLESAIGLARDWRERPRLVTLEGEILDAGGAMSGGRRNTASAVIGQARELRQLEQETSRAGAAATASSERLSALQEATRESRAALKSVQAELQSATAEASAKREREAIRQHLQAELQNLEASHEQELRRLEGEELPPEVSATELEQARSGLAAATAELSALEDRIREAARAEHEAGSALQLFSERLNNFKTARLRYEQDQGRLESLRNRIRDLDTEASELEQQVQSGAEALGALKAAPPADLAGLESELTGARLELRTASERLDNTGTELAAEQEQLERVRLTQARRETMLQSAAEEESRFPPGLKKLEGAERTLRARLQEVTDRATGLGPVNHRAAAELEQERLRSHTLAADLLDAEAAATELQRSLQEVDAEVTARSETAIAAVQESFVQHARELFGGEAEAGIEIQRDEGRPVGLLIRLQPPGKRTTQLNLLSVGERTMGALAFLFALMDGAGNQGLPIAVLDEVDAPLDEANISRFSSFVERLATRGTQFLLISHQKTTFRVADAMWGITSDRGVSSVFSISRADQQPELNFEQGTT